MFQSYRSFHEPDGQHFLKLLVSSMKNELPCGQMRDFLRVQDQTYSPELISAHPYIYVLDMLMEEFPAAKFILTIRDPLSWLDSFINHTKPNHTGYVGTLIGKQFRDLRMGTSQAHPAEEACLLENGLYTLDGYFAYWTKHIRRALDTIPSDKLLVVRTNDLDRRGDELAAFVGVAATSLNRESTHVHKAFRKLGVLAELDRHYLAEKCIQHCGELMLTWFQDDYKHLAALCANDR